MYKRYKPLLVSIFILLTVLMITGCREKKELSHPVITVVIAGNHGNSQRFESNLQNSIQRSYESFGNTAIIVNDGTPSVLYDDNGTLAGVLDHETLKNSREKSKKNNTLWKRNYLRRFTEDFEKMLINATPDCDESDLLTSLQKSVETLQFLKESVEILGDTDTSMEIIICDTGLSTSGRLNFLEGKAHQLLDCEQKISEDTETKEQLLTFLNNLENTAELPNLKGIAISWYGLGSVAAPQPSLTPLQRDNLEYIWKTLLKKSGAEYIDNADTATENGYFKSVIETGAAVYEYDVTPVIFWNNEAIKLPDDQLAFKKNSSELESKEIAFYKLEPYINNLKKYPDMNILICGTVADDKTNDSYIELSRKRAETVRNLLIEQGIAPERIKVLGLGINSPWYQNEWENGNFNETIAASNRAVHILAEDSLMGRRILDEYR